MRQFNVIVFILLGFSSFGQNTIKGIVVDGLNNEAIIGGNVIIDGTTVGTITDWDGSFEFTTDEAYPITLAISYIGYTDKLVEVVDDKKLKIFLEESSTMIEEVVVTGSRISEENKKSPLTVESLDVLAIKETAASNFYEGLGTLKGVDMTTASLGFQVINTRGFNSTSPVRSLQIIDGVDNQAPGLNFSLGNFLGSSELDVLKVDIIVGASSAFYGPNAFNGVINMQTKDPFFMKGLSASIKFGERNLKKGAARFAHALKNKEGFDWLAFKLNLEVLDADDWEAENYTPVSDSETSEDNPGRFDAVNIYGDEYRSFFDQSSANPWNQNTKGIGIYHRTGYREIDLLEYKTRNLKSNAAIHFRLKPSQTLESPELIFASSFSNGTTIYQGENRYALKDILFFQNRIEFKKKDKYFIRAYMTKDDAGNTYDPYFTALQLQSLSKSDADWNSAYTRYWQGNVIPRMNETGYPQLEPELDENGNLVFDSLGFPQFTFDYEGLDEWTGQFQDSLFIWHEEAEASANLADPATENFTRNFLEPGTPEFEEEFNRITSAPSGAPGGGSRLVDKSALYHVHGEYNFEPEFLNYWKVGSNARLYRPNSEGTIFIDSSGVTISNFEFGVYTGAEKKIHDNLALSATLRMDKNQNFDYLFSPAASLVYTPSENNFLRVSFSSAIRNPTLSDQYLDFDVGPATLRGNLNGVDGLVTIESFLDYREFLFQPELRDTLVKFSIAPIRPEKVKTFEIGYRSTLFKKLYVDAGYYYSIYDDFIGFNIGLNVALRNGFPTGVKAFRYSANSLNTVTTQGFSIGLNYFLGSYYKVGGNYSWNKLNTDIDDPIIPAFNTPEHKFNFGFSGRNMPLSFGGINSNKFGFNLNYKWIQGFVFEGSPQFTGPIDDYGLIDAQINYQVPSINSTIKVGASNLLDNKVYQTYGGPLVGRLAYISILYEFQPAN